MSQLDRKGPLPRGLFAAAQGGAHARQIVMSRVVARVNCHFRAQSDLGLRRDFFTSLSQSLAR